MGGGQPRVQREHTGLDAEAQDHGERHGQHQGFVACHRCRIQRTAGQKRQRIRKAVQEEQAK